jgi:hypothetical protein
MTKKEEQKELYIEAASAAAGALIGIPVRLWFVKKGLTILTGREWGWKETYFASSLVSLAGYYFAQGARGDAEQAKKLHDLRERLERGRG